MYLQVIILIVIWAVIYLLRKWRYVSQYWATYNVPHVPPHPIMGSLTFLQKKNPATFMRELYENFNTPYVGIWLFWRPALVINDPGIARRVLVKDSDKFRNRSVKSGKSDPIGELNLFTVNDPIWSAVRQRLSPVFTPAKLKAMHGLLIQKNKELIQRINNNLEAKTDVDLRTLFADFTTDVIGIASFGVESNATLTGESPLRTVTKEFVKFDVWRGIAWACIFFLPKVVDIFKFTFFPKNIIKYFRTAFRSIVEQRGGYDKASFDHGDLLDALIKMKRDAANDNEEMSEDLLIAQAAVFLQAGYDSTAVALTYATYELAFQPQYQQRIHDQIVELKERIGDADFDSNNLTSLTFLDCAIKETLRKYPIMGWLDRIAPCSYNIDDNLTIEAGTPIYVNVMGMQYDPKYHPDPEIFNPDRFLPENENKMDSFTFMPFGEGPRHCIGTGLAMRTLRSALAHLFLNFKVVPRASSPSPSDCELEKQGLFLTPGEPLYVDFVPRTKSL